MIELLLQLAFEEGRAYQRLYDKIGLDNVIDFNDIEYANSLGARWKFKGDMSDLPELFKTKNIELDGIKALNDIAKDLEKIKIIANHQLTTENNKSKI